MQTLTTGYSLFTNDFVCLLVTTQQATYFILNQLRAIYPDGEAGKIADLAIEHLTGSPKTERMLYKNAAITEKEEMLLIHFTKRLLEYEPVQYVLNEAWFYGLKFYVDQNVLIPRPETEEMVDQVITDCKFPIDELKILDIGSGSGCIPIALKRKLRKAEVWSCDISREALEVAKKNAAALGAEINFIHLDFLDKTAREELPSFNIIISNPPYVPEKDKTTMQPNVVQYEPATALFVPDDDPLIFYKAIVSFGKTHLNQNGKIYLEIHESQGNEVKKLFSSAGYTTTIRKDMQGKERIVMATMDKKS